MVILASNGSLGEVAEGRQLMPGVLTSRLSVEYLYVSGSRHIEPAKRDGGTAWPMSLHGEGVQPRQMWPGWLRYRSRSFRMC